MQADAQVRTGQGSGPLNHGYAPQVMRLKAMTGVLLELMFEIMDPLQWERSAIKPNSTVESEPRPLMQGSDKPGRKIEPVCDMHVQVAHQRSVQPGRLAL